MNYAGCVLLLELLVSPDRSSSAKYILKTRDFIVEMRIDFPDRYTGRPLELYTGPRGDKKTCFAEEAGLPACPERFVGAMAVVRFSLRRADGTIPRKAAIREWVSVVDQSPGLAPRAPVSMTTIVVGGVASDVQAFGYDEAAIPQLERPVAREQWKRLWRTYRQELYLDRQTEPFAVVEWHHAISEIRLVRLSEGPRTN